jgi:hypothetical protein
MSVATIRPFYPTQLDDELVALTLQLEELGLASEAGKGKYPVNHPPDFEVAFASFQAELQEYKTFLEIRSWPRASAPLSMLMGLSLEILLRRKCSPMRITASYFSSVMMTRRSRHPLDPWGSGVRATLTIGCPRLRTRWLLIRLSNSLTTRLKLDPP